MIKLLRPEGKNYRDSNLNFKGRNNFLTIKTTEKCNQLSHEVGFPLYQEQVDIVCHKASFSFGCAGLTLWSGSPRRCQALRILGYPSWVSTEVIHGRELIRKSPMYILESSHAMLKQVEKEKITR